MKTKFYSTLALLVVAGLLAMGLNWGSPNDPGYEERKKECQGREGGHVVALIVRVTGRSSSDVYANRLDVVWWLTADNNGSRTVQRTTWVADATVQCGQVVRVTGKVHSKGLRVRCIVRQDGRQVVAGRETAGACSEQYTVV